MATQKRQGKLLWALPGLLLTAGVLASACSSPATVPPSSSSSSTGSTTTPVGSPDQLLNAGVAALSAGKTSQAKADFNAVIAGDPSDKYLNNNIAYYDLGVIAQTHGDNAVAETDYKGAILLDPHYVAADYNLAILEAATDPQGAITLYRQVLVLSPSDVNAIYNLGLLLIQGGQTAEGEQYLNQAIKIDPSLIKKVPAGVTP